MDFGSFYIPDKSKSSTRGDDAYFISKHHQTIGLADGVAGWAKQGIDGGEYARQLMDNCVTTLYAEDKEIVYPQMVLEEAYSNTNVEGSSTACIITLTDEELMIGVRAGDVVVVGTDGLFDNVFVDEMEVVIRVLREEGCMEPQLLAKVLAELAEENSLIKSGDSPYTIAALMEGKFRSGGKPDDITVIVARIAARLVGPPAKFDASKLKVVPMGEEIDNYSGIIPRVYTLSHCDFTANLTLTISNIISLDQVPLKSCIQTENLEGAEVAVLCITKSEEVLNHQTFTDAKGIYRLAGTMPESDRWDAMPSQVNQQLP
ncbi:hypothetical protein VitviT2T_027000 [Vitis vinifera]|uniref:Protein phosphatase n=1 Tax=Vitis vinifera TaxID=29760 RepID=A0ABY9DPM3_VITVI|nr:hypothetical protein VitviT2T_027000 [Vitis vinifera]